MSVHYVTTGFVFKKEDRQEADRIFSVFTRDFGRVELFAKAIRRISSKLKGGIEIFSLSDISFIQGKNRKTLIDATVVENFSNIPKNPEKTAAALKACRVLDIFIQGQELDEKMWKLVVDFFQKLDQEPRLAAASRLMYYYFIWNLFLVLGYGPELFKCSHCAKSLDSQHLSFSHKEGGVICSSCAATRKDAKKINPDVVKTLRLLINQDWATMIKLKIEPDSLNLLKEISRDYGRYILPQTLSNSQHY